VKRKSCHKATWEESVEEDKNKNCIWLFIKNQANQKRGSEIQKIWWKKINKQNVIRIRIGYNYWRRTRLKVPSFPKLKTIKILS
jgi:hypothetical protein